MPKLQRLFFFLPFVVLSSSAMVTTGATPLQRCAVVGVGVLGTSLCQQILESSEDTTVTGITKSTTHHASIREQIGSGSMSNRFNLVTVDECDEKFENVVFCAPPSGSDDYPSAVKEATIKYWAGPDAGGVFVFTSSGAVYGPSDKGVVTETSKISDVSVSPRIARLVNAEKSSLEAGGCCLRLAGLYNLKRGAHNYWITSEKPVNSSPDGIINLLHYEDAASACLAALKAGPAVCNGKVFLISDGHPLSRQGICESALKAAAYRDDEMPLFEGKDEPWALGKIYDGTATTAALNWKPKYHSFDEFMEANAS